jgi:hypothetical protein
MAAGKTPAFERRVCDAELRRVRAARNNFSASTNVPSPSNIDGTRNSNATRACHFPRGSRPGRIGNGGQRMEGSGRPGQRFISGNSHLQKQVYPSIGELKARAAETDEANSDKGLVFQRRGRWI